MSQKSAVTTTSEITIFFEKSKNRNISETNVANRTKIFLRKLGQNALFPLASFPAGVDRAPGACRYTPTMYCLPER